ncbi:efflux RND transporter periplasmic adaptor subunit [Marinimicrobium alkaliphilum]|uniref:efflux RND transporter periplasmic adaptor subunit n=1 Tax=Marinimicrobium alkaliphilum TaxID=2202654 RepID=UPI000DB963D2|nr:efflux RND transporter periplasmic adaptor subunit [Marinimicrobium alkaliphilum]
MNVSARRLLRLPPVLIVLAVGALAITLLMVFKPRPQPFPEPEPPKPVVEVVTAEPQRLSLPVQTQGTVRPRRQIELVSQVAGRVEQVAPAFVSGGYIAQGEWLVALEEQDYEHALIRARARVAETESLLASERGLARQAEREWRDLGSEDANALFLRRPQIAAAEGALAAARADLAQAELELARTRVRLPFDARVMETHVELGQYVTPGTPIATVFDAAVVEVALPLTDTQAALVDLPLIGQRLAREALPVVTLRARVAGDPGEWQGRITRTRASVDTQSRLLHAIAEVESPFDTDVHPLPLLVGTFVEAEIAGRALDGLVALPVSAVFRRNRVYTLDGRTVQEKTVQVIHRDDARIWVRGDLAEGEKIISDRQGYVSPGMEVTLPEDSSENDEGETES